MKKNKMDQKNQTKEEFIYTVSSGHDRDPNPGEPRRWKDIEKADNKELKELKAALKRADDEIDRLRDGFLNIIKNNEKVDKELRADNKELRAENKELRIRIGYLID